MNENGFNGTIHEMPTAEKTTYNPGHYNKEKEEREKRECLIPKCLLDALEAAEILSDKLDDISADKAVSDFYPIVVEDLIDAAVKISTEIRDCIGQSIAIVKR